MAKKKTKAKTKKRSTSAAKSKKKARPKTLKARSLKRTAATNVRGGATTTRAPLGHKTPGVALGDPGLLAIKEPYSGPISYKDPSSLG
jgi:hypothetical protein